jgi:hypothetical protein
MQKIFRKVHLEYQDAQRRIIIKWILKEQDERMGTELFWLRIVTSGEIL